MRWLMYMSIAHPPASAVFGGCSPTRSSFPHSVLQFLIDAHGEVVELGEGTFALVLLARLVPGRQNVAVKARAGWPSKKPDLR